ncbi:MAG: response regulator [Chloroflexota bacterium]|jgi:CheY-like chemotaxis protein
MTKTVLIIDDDATLRRALASALRSEGYDIVLAANGQEAVALCANGLPDAIICDVMMPYMDGVATFRALQSELQVRNVPMIITTALHRQAWFTDLEEEGAVFMPKPLDLPRLSQILRDSLS